MVSNLLGRDGLARNVQQSISKTELENALLMRGTGNFSKIYVKFNKHGGSHKMVQVKVQFLKAGGSDTVLLHNTDFRLLL